MEKLIFKYECPFCKDKSIYTPQELSIHFIQMHNDISPDKMTDWFISKSKSKESKKNNKLNQLKGYDKKLKNKKNKKWVKIIYTPMGNKR
ncbi:hypothetical protein U0R10_02090 [Aquirufa sp. OSTEICH-129V]|uniref:C2H2-type domain-containing protein n=1 Tax=Aquirufa avitistagni TaxID=3104728 RepID=A0ABW6D9F0_9BACT